MASPATGKKSTTQRWACLKSTANFSPKLNIVLTDPTTSPVRVEISIQRRNWKRLLALEKMATKADGYDEVFVGRIRRDFSVPYGINLWVVADNLRKGWDLAGEAPTRTLAV